MITSAKIGSGLSRRVIPIIALSILLNGLLLAEPVAPKPTRLSYESVRSKVEDANPKSDVPIGQRVFVSGPEHIKKKIGADGNVTYEKGYSTAIIRHSTDMTAATLVHQLGLSTALHSVHIYRSDSQTPIIVENLIYRHEIKPLDAIRVFYTDKISSPRAVGDFDTAHERALRSRGSSVKPAPTGEIGLSTRQALR